ncbi:MAG TPA: ABC transporter permease [Gemmatimonadaceae bacterium]
MRNVKLAIRTLAKSPFVTAVAVLSLALGIGANAAIFSLFEQLLLRSVPAAEPGRLVNLAAPGPKPGSQSCGQAGSCEEVFSYPMFRDLEKAQTAFSGLAGHRSIGISLAVGKETRSGEGMLVSGSYFPVLGLNAALGRLLTPADDQTIGANFVAVLSYRYWETHLGLDRSVLNEQVMINGQSFTVVGVAPRGFYGTTVGTNADVFVPISMYKALVPRTGAMDNRASYWIYVFGRLKPNVTIEQAHKAINLVYHPIVRDVEAPLQRGMSDQTMALFKAKQVTVTEGRRGQSSIHDDAKTPLAMLFAVTGIVLLIACANIANLLLARGAGRATEMAVRLSLGAQRRHVLGQLLTESCVLALIAGVVSLVFATWTLSLLAQILPGNSDRVIDLGLSWPIVMFAMALSLGTGMLFGLYPALHSTRRDLLTSIRAGSGQPSGARAASRFRFSLVTAQVALAMMLLTSAGLFIKSLRNVSRVDLGLDIGNLVTFTISPELNGYDSTRSAQLFARVEEELAALPGVSAVTSSMVGILSGNNWGSDVSVEGFKGGPDVDANARFNEIGPGYFRALGIPLMAGREFTPADGPGRPGVAIVNEAFAKKFNLGTQAVGKRMSVRGSGNQDLDTEIVGLVRNAAYSEVKDEVPPLFFTPHRQDNRVGEMTFYARTTLSTSELLRSIPVVVARIDPNLPVDELRTMPEQVKENVFMDRMIGTLSSSFALLATLLAAIGLYGVLAYTVAQRTREIGVRMALGAHGGRVRGMILRQVGVVTLIGGAVGLAAAIGLARAARSLLFRLEGWDPVVLSIAAVLLTAVALGAGYVPALRASRVDPMKALRYE